MTILHSTTEAQNKGTSTKSPKVSLTLVSATSLLLDDQRIPPFTRQPSPISSLGALAGGVLPATSGTSAAGAGTAAVGTGSIPTIPTPAYPTNTPPAFNQSYTYPPTEVSAVNDLSLIRFQVTSDFPSAAAAAGAVAVTYSASGSPPWSGKTVPTNGFFSIPFGDLSNGDVVQVRVTPGNGTIDDSVISPGVTVPISSATLEYISNARGGAAENAQFIAVTPTYIYFNGLNRFNAVKLYRVHKTTNVVTQIGNMTGNQETIDPVPNTPAVAVVGESVFLNINNQLYMVDASGTISSTVDANAFNPIAVGTIINGRNFLTGNGYTAYGAISGFCHFAASFSGNYKLCKVDAAGVVSKVSNTTGTSDLLNDVNHRGIYWNGHLYIGLKNGAGWNKLVKVHPTTDVITILSNTKNSTSSHDNVQVLAATANYLYFTAQDPSSRTRLFRVDTSDVVTCVCAINPSGSDTFVAYASVVYNDEFYFVLTHSPFNKLYKITEAGVCEFAADTANCGPSSDMVTNATIVAVPSGIYFLGVDARGLNRLFKLTTSGVTCAGRLLAGESLTGGFSISGVDYLIMTTAIGGQLVKIGTTNTVISELGSAGSSTFATGFQLLTGSSFYTTVTSNPKIIKFTP
jgi:hypothetical protein